MEETNIRLSDFFLLNIPITRHTNIQIMEETKFSGKFTTQSNPNSQSRISEKTGMLYRKKREVNVIMLIHQKKKCDHASISIQTHLTFDPQIAKLSPAVFRKSHWRTIERSVEAIVAPLSKMTKSAADLTLKTTARTPATTTGVVHHICLNWSSENESSLTVLTFTKYIHQAIQFQRFRHKGSNGDNGLKINRNSCKNNFYLFIIRHRVTRDSKEIAQLFNLGQILCYRKISFL